MAGPSHDGDPVSPPVSWPGDRPRLAEPTIENRYAAGTHCANVTLFIRVHSRVRVTRRRGASPWRNAP
jgi:hypothetical protein